MEPANSSGTYASGSHGLVSPRLVRKASNLPSSPAFTTLGLEEDDPEDVFEIQSKEGAGAFGRVFRACYRRDRTRLAALKVIPVALEAGQRGEDVENVRREIQFLRECDHPNVVAFYGAYYKDGALWVAMEYCGGGSVADVCRQRALREDEIAVIVRGALRGLAYLHARKKIHRDIKGGNILLTLAGEVKIADFGVSAQLKDTMSRRGTFVGTPYWMSPEMIQDSEYDARSDIWSLGITMIELADQTPPLFDEHPMRVLIQIPRNPPPQVRQPARWSPLFSQFLAFCLRKNPRERPSALECLEHPFLARVAHVPLVFADGRTGVVGREEEGGWSEDCPHVHEAEEEENESGARADGATENDATLRSHRSAPPVSSSQQPGDPASSSSSCRDSVSRTSRRTNQVDAHANISDDGLGTPKDQSLVGCSGLGTPSEHSDAVLVSSGSSSSSNSSSHEDEDEHAGDADAPDEQFIFRDSSGSTSDVRPATIDDPHDDQERLKEPAGSTARLEAAARVSSLAVAPAIASSSSPITRSKHLPSHATRFMTPPATERRGLFASFVSGSRQARDVARRPAADAPAPPAHPLDGLDSSRDRVSQLVQSLSASAAAELKAAAATAGGLSGSSVKTSSDDAAAQFIGTPFRVAHPVRVSFNTLHARFEGVPDTDTWRAIHQQFGVPLATLRCRSGRSDHVPALLEMLRRELLARDGLSAKFVYRVPADQREVQLARQAINRGAFDPRAITDPHVFASLLKQWLRELPTPLLGNLSRTELVEIQRLVVGPPLTTTNEPKASDGDLVWATTPGDVHDTVHSKVLALLPKAEQGVLLWLVDHALEVVAHASSNAMTAHSLAVVLAPTLYRWAAATPEDAVATSHQVATLVRVLIAWRKQERSVSERSNKSSSTRWPGSGSSDSVRWSLNGRAPPDERRLTASVRSRAMLRDSFDVSLSAARGSWRKTSVEVQQLDGQIPAEPQQHSGAAGTSLTAHLRELVDQLWTALPSSLVVDAASPCPPIVRTLHATFQRAVVDAIQRYGKREDEHAWAAKAFGHTSSVKVEALSSMDELPPSLRRLSRWLGAALDLSAFMALLQHERAVSQTIDRLKIPATRASSSTRSERGIGRAILQLSSKALDTAGPEGSPPQQADISAGALISDPGILSDAGSMSKALAEYKRLLRVETLNDEVEDPVDLFLGEKCFIGVSPQEVF
ncbi:hypothetical protein P43SY_004451 [Pythium insidiosum]|uniref:STE/STE20/MST protein kinase n=1 Tax=Pythium insidiosum TaxID=114742 RepID=A0AAD5LQ52_PYTIN|nr:hypothetical protein P43SY_004451 [Pythium insidiosum]